MSKRSEAVIRWRQRMKLKLIEAFDGKCGICGYSKSVRALGFHHLDPSAKDFGFASSVPRAWKRIVDEAKKCVMLCQNCHAEIHDGVTTIPDNIRRFVEPENPPRMRRLVVRRNGSNPYTERPQKVPNRPRGENLRQMVNLSSRNAVAQKYGVSETAVRKWLVADTKAGISQTWFPKA
jgi:hypothetical protein